MMKRLFFMFAILFMVSFAFAGSYHDHYEYDRYDSEHKDYYWAKDYYRSSDYVRHSDYRYDHDGYYDSRSSHSRNYYRHTRYDDRDRYDRYPYDLHDRRGRYQGNKIFVRSHDYYVDDYDYKVHYSHVMDKYYTTKCYVNPPRDYLIYVRC